jgi:hypothetical protein
MRGDWGKSEEKTERRTTGMGRENCGDERSMRGELGKSEEKTEWLRVKQFGDGLP